MLRISSALVPCAVGGAALRALPLHATNPFGISRHYCLLASQVFKSKIFFCDHKSFTKFLVTIFFSVSPIVTEHRHTFHYSKRRLFVNTSQGGPLAGSLVFSFSESFFFRFFSLDTSAIFFNWGLMGRSTNAESTFFFDIFFLEKLASRMRLVIRIPTHQWITHGSLVF